MATPLVSADAIERELQKHPFAQYLRSEFTISESRYYQKIPVGKLVGPCKITVPSLAFYEAKRKSFYLIMHVGSAVAGNPEMIHGSLLTTMMDEGLAGCVSAALPGREALALHLSIDYRKPAPTDSFYVLRAKALGVEGQSVMAEGKLQILDADSTGSGDVVVEGYGQYLQR